jgi:DNA-binding IclR family transcriptional regulator
MPQRPSPLQTPDKDGTQSLRRGLAALRLLASGPRDGMRMTDIVARMGLNKTTVVRITKALCDEQFLDFDALRKLYRLGPESFAIGLAAEPNYVLQRLANPLLDALAKESGDTVFFSIRAGFEAICLSRHEGSFPIRNQVLKPGDRFPLGVGAGSVAMLAALQDHEVHSILQTNAPWITMQYPHCTLSTIKTQIRNTREKGYSLNPGWVVEGSWGIGVQVFSATGEVVAAISLAAIEKRLNLSRRALLANQLMLASQGLTEQLALAN